MKIEIWQEKKLFRKEKLLETLSGTEEEIWTILKNRVACGLLNGKTIRWIIPKESGWDFSWNE